MSYPEKPKPPGRRLSPAYAARLVRQAFERAGVDMRLLWTLNQVLDRGAAEIGWETLWSIASLEFESPHKYQGQRVAVAIIASALKRSALPRSLQPRAAGGWTPILSDALNVSPQHINNLAYSGRRVLLEHGAPKSLVEGMKQTRKERDLDRND